MSQTAASSYFYCQPAPDHPGWLQYDIGAADAYNRNFLGLILVRREEGDTARIRLAEPHRRHINNSDNYHGGTILGLIDIALFAALYLVKGNNIPGSVTLDLQNQFIGAGNPAQPLDALVEVLHETRRMCFLRGLVVQGEGDEHLVASFTGTIRKGSGTGASTPR